MSAITTIGEILIDLTQTGVTDTGVPEYAAYPGGAPANVAVAAARLGADVSFIGKVGDDSFGELLRRTLEENQVDTTHLYTAQTEKTSLVVVDKDEEGESLYTFYRSPGADSLLTQKEAAAALTKLPRLFHFGSVALTQEPAKSTVLVTAAMARRMDVLVSFDPNYRASLWPSAADAAYTIKQALPLCDIIKLNQAELELLTGTSDVEKGAAELTDNGIFLVLVTLGNRGVYYRYRGKTGTVPAYPCTMVDSNGAGDTFFGAFLSRLAQFDRSASPTIPIPVLEDMLAFANKAAAIAVTRSGAIPAMPTLAEVEAL